jgi:hypothetical protein
VASLAQNVLGQRMPIQGNIPGIHPGAQQNIVVVTTNPGTSVVGVTDIAGILFFCKKES